jgi:hypothetical protein
MLEEFATQVFWLNLLKIIGVNIILSGDNAVVIALAARSLPQNTASFCWCGGKERAASAITTALSPERSRLTQMILPRPIQKSV